MYISIDGIDYAAAADLTTDLQFRLAGWRKVFDVFAKNVGEYHVLLRERHDGALTQFGNNNPAHASDYDNPDKWDYLRYGRHGVDVGIYEKDTGTPIIVVGAYAPDRIKIRSYIYLGRQFTTACGHLREPHYRRRITEETSNKYVELLKKIDSRSSRTRYGIEYTDGGWVLFPGIDSSVLLEVGELLKMLAKIIEEYRRVTHISTNET